MNTYTILDHGKLIATELISTKVAELIGTDRHTVSNCARAKKPYLGRYVFIVDGEADDDRVHQLPPKLEKAWNDMMQAAEKLKSGEGKLVTRNGKKYVEVI